MATTTTQEETTVAVVGPNTAREVSKVAALVGVRVEHFYLHIMCVTTSYYDAWNLIDSSVREALMLKCLDFSYQ